MTLEQSLTNLMTNNKLLRANDKLLILAQWRKEGLELTAQQEQVFMKLSSSESIRRTRQRIQERRQCMPDGLTTMYRQAKASKIKQAIRKEKQPIYKMVEVDGETVMQLVENI
jgi:hypothetical protein